MPDLYSEILLDHYHMPRNQGQLDDATVTVDGVNPLCGDELTFDLKFDGDRIAAIRFRGKGCAISMASASMLTEVLQGKTLAEAEEWIARFRDFVRNGKAPEGIEMGDLAALEGVAQLPVRVKCASLPWTTVAEGLHKAHVAEESSE